MNRVSIEEPPEKGHPAESQAESTPHEHKERGRLIQKRYLEEALEDTACRYTEVYPKRVKALEDCRIEHSEQHHCGVDWDKLRAELEDATNRDNESLNHLRRLLPGSKLNDEDVDRILQSFEWDESFQILKTSYLEEGWTPNAKTLSIIPPTEKLILPVCRSNHWTLLLVHLGGRLIYHFDSLNGRSPSSGHESCAICQSMATTVDKALMSFESKPAIPSSWDFCIWNEERSRFISPQQRNNVDCGIFLLYNAHCVSRNLDPWDMSPVADELRAGYTAKLLQEDVCSGIIPGHVIQCLVRAGSESTEMAHSQAEDRIPADRYQARAETGDSSQSPAIDENIRKCDGLGALCSKPLVGDAGRRSLAVSESPVMCDAGSPLLPVIEYDGFEASIQSLSTDLGEYYPLSQFLYQNEGISEFEDQCIAQGEVV